MKLFLKCLSFLLVPVFFVQTLQAQQAAFYSEIQRFKKLDSAAFPPKDAILLVGSSSFTKWQDVQSYFPGYTIINRGFGGSTLPEVIHYVRRLVLPYRPRMVVLYAGDNDIAAGRSPRRVADDYQTFLRIVRDALPATRIVFVSLKPSPSRWALNEQVREANRLVRAITATDPLQSFVDVFTPMLGTEGRPRPELFVADSLHMTAAGYSVWRSRLAPIVK
jgi:lysophospholipase L1-like esterase